MGAYRFDEPEVRRSLKLLAPPVTELRCMDAYVEGERRRRGRAGDSRR